MRNSKYKKSKKKDKNIALLFNVKLDVYVADDVEEDELLKLCGSGLIEWAACIKLGSFIFKLFLCAFFFFNNFKNIKHRFKFFWFYFFCCW